MKENDIEVGDIVTIHFTTSKSLHCVKVLYTPQDVGDCWRLTTGLPNGIINVISFERMDLIRKGEYT